MSCRTLVITLGQLRAHQLTWGNFKTNVLEQLDADLAVCVPNDAFFDFTNPFYLNARFRWPVPDAADLANTFDCIQRLLGSSDDWRVLCDVKGSWIGRIAQSNQPGAAAILFVLRWFMLNNIQAAQLTDMYDRFIVTRSDYYYFCPHPPLEYLDAEYLWVPDGEDCGGLSDRHLVVSASNLVASCNLIDDLLLRPHQMRAAMIAKSDWNIEQIIAFHLTRNGLISRIKRFPYIMFLVRAPEDPTAWSTGTYVSDAGMVVKYPTEFREAERYRHLIRSNDDWRSYFSFEIFRDILPARIYTSHGTVLYVDEITGELRHGPLVGSPVNVFFAFAGAGGTITHNSGDRRYNIIYLSDYSKSSFADPVNDTSVRSETIFDRVSMYDNMIGLRSGDLYLCAEPDGRIALNRRNCHTWEYFRLITHMRETVHAEQGRDESRGRVQRPVDGGPDHSRINHIFRFLHFVFENCRQSRAQLFQDLWVLFELCCKREGYFVEFGAGDGVDGSNTYLLEQEYGWSGIVAEPNPIHGEALKQNRRCYLSSRCISAVSNESVAFMQAKDPIYSTIDKYASRDMHSDSRRQGTTILVDTLSLLDLLINAKAPKKIDYISVDTEGSEFDILAGFDFDAYDIRLISVEHNFTPQRELLFGLLKKNGYERRFSELSRWDDWYVKVPQDKSSKPHRS